MADFRVPLDAVEALTGRRHRLHTADGRLCKPDKPLRHHRDLIRMRRPYLHPVGVALQEVALFQDIDLDRTEPAARAPPNRTPAGRRHDVQPEADAEDGKIEVKVVGSSPGTVEGRAAAEDDPPATPGDLGRGRGVRDHCGRDVHITERPEDQVVELPVIVDHIERKHCS